MEVRFLVTRLAPFALLGEFKPFNAKHAEVGAKYDAGSFGASVATTE